MNREQLLAMYKTLACTEHGMDPDKDVSDEELQKAIETKMKAGKEFLVNEEQLEKAISNSVEKIVAPVKEELKETKEKLSQKALFDKEAPEGKAAVKKTADFFRAMRKRDKNELSKAGLEMASEVKGLSEGVDAEGGFAVHPEFHREVFKLMETFGIGRQICRVLPMGSNEKDISSITAKPVAEMVGERTATSTDTKPTFGQIVLIAKKSLANIISSTELIEDNSTDQEIWDLMAELLAEAFAKLEDEQVFQGDGTGNNLTGFLVSSDATINIVTMATGDTAFTDLDADDLLDMQDAVPESVAKVGIYVLHRSIFNIVRKLKDTQGNYIYQSPQGNVPATIWDMPFVLTESMPSKTDTAVDTKFLMFGDFRVGGVIGNRRDLTLKQLFEGTINSVNLAETDQEALRGRQRLAFSVGLGDAIAILKTAAS